MTAMAIRIFRQFRADGLPEMGRRRAIRSYFGRYLRGAGGVE